MLSEIYLTLEVPVMHRSFRRTFVAAVVGAALLGTSQAPVSVASVAADPTPAPAPTDSSASEASDSAITARTSDSADAAVCTANTNGDYVHRSSTGFAASGHGWWTNVNCNTTLADVTVQLQQYYSDGVWRNVGSPGKARVASGGGAGNRATGRVDCVNSSRSGWRSIVDVDLVGLIDDTSVLVTPSRNIDCRV